MGFSSTLYWLLIYVCCECHNKVCFDNYKPFSIESSVKSLKWPIGLKVPFHYKVTEAVTTNFFLGFNSEFMGFCSESYSGL